MWDAGNIPQKDAQKDVYCESYGNSTLRVESIVNLISNITNFSTYTI
jgi:hypothetical protein